MGFPLAKHGTNQAPTMVTGSVNQGNITVLDFPGGSVVKNPSANAEDTG